MLEASSSEPALKINSSTNSDMHQISSIAQASWRPLSGGRRGARACRSCPWNQPSRTSCATLWRRQPCLLSSAPAFLATKAVSPWQNSLISERPCDRWWSPGRMVNPVCNVERRKKHKDIQGCFLQGLARRGSVRWRCGRARRRQGASHPAWRCMQWCSRMPGRLPRCGAGMQSHAISGCRLGQTLVLGASPERRALSHG